MEDITVWFNPNCSKCRQLRDYLEEKELDVDYRHYLDEAPTLSELEHLLTQIGGDAQQLLRSKEDIYKSLGLSDADNEELLAALLVHPELLNRPVLASGDRAIIARPPELGLEFLGL